MCWNTSKHELQVLPGAGQAWSQGEVRSPGGPEYFVSGSKFVRVAYQSLASRSRLAETSRRRLCSSMTRRRISCPSFDFCLIHRTVSRGDSVSSVHEAVHGNVNRLECKMGLTPTSLSDQPISFVAIVLSGKFAVTIARQVSWRTRLFSTSTLSTTLLF